jgi:hypothetical protein
LTRSPCLPDGRSVRLDELERTELGWVGRSLNGGAISGDTVRNSPGRLLTGRLVHLGKAPISAELAGIYERLNCSTAASLIIAFPLLTILIDYVRGDSAASALPESVSAPIVDAAPSL